MSTSIVGGRRVATSLLMAVVFLLASTALAAPARAAASPATVDLGTAAPFAVLAGQSVSNTGDTVLDGDLGVSPGTAITGFPPGLVTGDVERTTAVAAQAQDDLTAAYDDAAGRPSDVNLTGQDLGGQTLTPGVHTFDTSAFLTGSLTLDAQGDADAVFIFQIGSTLITASGSTVQLINGAQACRVFFQVGSSATLGTDSTFVGTIVALASITANTGATVDGRLLARNGSVTLDDNLITTPTCTPPPGITVMKAASPTSRPAPGGSFSYTATVTNTGSGSVTLTSLVDDRYGDLDDMGTCDTGGSIAAGGSYTCTFSKAFTGEAGDTHTNTITASVTDAGGAIATGAGTTTVTISEPAPAVPSITVAKDASPTSRPAPGGAFAFTATVANTGAESVTLSSLTDDVYGNLNGQGTCRTGGAIAAGTSYTCTFSRTINGDAGKTHTNVITAVVSGAGGSTATGDDSATVTLTQPATGVLEICKRADNTNGPVTGNYTFTFAGRSVTVPVGACTGPLTVRAGNLTVTEVAKTGTRMSACATRPTVRLVKCDPVNRQAVVRIVEGGVANETVLFVTNKVPSGTTTNAAIKVCKIAGPGVALGTTFSFAVGTKSVSVPAGPADQGGYCKFVYGFTPGTNVTVTEAARTGTRVSAISINPADRKVSSSLTQRTATLRAAAGTTVVTFTNTAA